MDGFAAPQNYFAPRPPTQRRRPTGLWALLAALGLALVGAVVWLIVETTAGPDHQQSQRRDAPAEVVSASDGHSEMAIPSDWGVMPEDWQAPGAVIARGHLFQQRFVMVVTDDKAGFKDFDDYAETASISVEAIAENSVGQSVDTTVGGLPARAFEANGTFEGEKVVFWCTVVDGANGYHQILAWTLADNRAAAEGPIKTIISSFRER